MLLYCPRCLAINWQTGGDYYAYNNDDTDDVDDPNYEDFQATDWAYDDNSPIQVGELLFKPTLMELFYDIDHDDAVV